MEVHIQRCPHLLVSSIALLILNGLLCISLIPQAVLQHNPSLKQRFLNEQLLNDVFDSCYNGL